MVAVMVVVVAAMVVLVTITVVEFGGNDGHGKMPQILM